MPQPRPRPGRALAVLAISTAAFLAAAFAPNQAAAQASSCESLGRVMLPSTTIRVAQSVPAGTFTPPDGSVPIAGLPAFCRVAGTIAPTGDSAIGFEVWLPASGWNGRYLQNGNGGFGGTIPYAGLAGALLRGFATAGTDDGHTGPALDASWALGHPEKIADFGYRAVHETAVKSEAVVATFFGTAAAHSYFVGCSDGGREGMMETQRYPDDFDGWVIGAPAYYWSGFIGDFIWNQQAISATPGSALPNAKLQLLSSAVTAQCDAQDGVADGVIDNPRACRFDPGVLQCAAGVDRPTCLSADQVAAVRKIYAGPRNPRTGHVIYPGFDKGLEADPVDWPAWITGPYGTGSASPERILANATGANFVFNDPNWSLQTFNFDSGQALLRAKVDPDVSALETDLAGFAAAGKKIIQYHGWADGALPPLATIAYYRTVAERLGRIAAAERSSGGRPGGSLPQIASFYRLFMAPGMAHCSGGAGPNAFGQTPLPEAVPPVVDPKHDAISAAVRWVEQGVPPDQIIATKYVNDDPAQGVRRTRPLCPYPQAARHTGSGSLDDAANFVCATDTASGPVLP